MVRYSVEKTIGLALDLGISQEAIAVLSDLLTDEVLANYQQLCHQMTVYELSEAAYKQLADELEGQDPDGMLMLGLMLAAATDSRATYEHEGISEEIFRETMDCFPRFLAEDLEQHGHTCFTRAFWAWRQLSLRLFRIGLLEFEYVRPNKTDSRLVELSGGRMILSVHIPSDVIMTKDSLHASYQHGYDFFCKHEARLCPEGLPVLFFCSTWLLSPELNALLPEGSRIKQFYSDYEIYEVDLEDKGFYYWLFAEDENPDTRPKRSSLQRTVHRHLLAGGKIGSAAGVIPVGRFEYTNRSIK